MTGHMSSTGRTANRLRQKLQETTGLPAIDFLPSTRFNALIPHEERRRVWRELQENGLALPELELSSRAFFMAACFVLAPLFALGWVLKNWTVLLSLAELGWLARKITRPWAVHPPRGCETIREAVLNLTPFSHQDYQAGLWPRKDIFDKVRVIVAQVADVPFDSITTETRLLDLDLC